MPLGPMPTRAWWPWPMPSATACKVRGTVSSGSSTSALPSMPERCFVGFDAYQKLIESGVDVVLLATPPHFRPIHLKACIDAGKHVFCEKPVAVDAPGCEAYWRRAKRRLPRSLNVVSGLCWRYDYGVRETMKRVLDGAIGEIICHSRDLSTRARSGSVRGNRTGLRWSTRCATGTISPGCRATITVEQHVHSLDKAAWAMHDEPPFGPGAWAVARSARKRSTAISSTIMPFATNMPTASRSTPTAARWPVAAAT